MAEAAFVPAGSRLVAPAGAVVAAFDRLASELQTHVARGPAVLLGVMLGGVVPLVEIARRLRGDFLLDYCHLTRYDGARAGGEVRWLQQPRIPLEGKSVIIVDDIYDEGATLAEARRHCVASGARDVRVAVLVRKRHDRAVHMPLPEHVGLEVGDEYVFGCGMDLDGRWRHLDALYAAAP